MKRILLTAIALVSLIGTTRLHAERLELKDLTSGKYTARRIYGVHPLADGERYSQLSQDARQIVAYSFRNGQQTGVLLDVGQTRGQVKIDRIDGYIMSPDEKNILVRTQTKSIYRRSHTGVYYIYNMLNRTLTPLSDGGPQECPVWSPDGYMVAFVREGNIYLVKLLYNNSESQVTKDGEFNKVINGKPDWVYEEEFVTDQSLTFTADNTMLCWIRYDESDVPLFSFPWYKGLNPEKKEYLTYPGQYEYKYPMAGEQNSRVSVLSYDIKSHQTRTLQVPLDKDGYIPRIFATSDATKLAVVTLNRHQDRMDIYMANPRSTEARLVVRDQVEHYIGENAYGQISFVDGGFFMTSERDGWNHVYQYDLNGTLKRKVTQGNIVVSDFYGYDPRTLTYYYAATDGSPLRRAVFKTDAKGRVTKLSTETGTNSAVFSRSLRYYMNVYSNLQTPPVTSLCDNTGRTLKTLVDNHELISQLADKELGTREFFTFKTSGGTELNGYMVRPHDFDPQKRYPVIMFQYSGPGSQQVLDSWQTGNMGGCLYEQYLAQQGFISVCVDGRGTGGRGAAFEKQTYLRLGQLEAEDQVETALYLGTLPYVDKQRIGIWGWSYGGFCTLMSMSEGRPVFAAGVAVAPPTCWRYYDSVYTERFMRTPQENPDGYDVSAISRAPQLAGRLLICHGLADDNVHFRNTAEYTEALVQADKDFRQLTYTNRNHSIYGGNTRYHLFRQITQWFQQM
ncbi:MAG: S9 family peptidase [Bacteroidaceae bacterium]|nr:S9 family peptidase [Bacteroidaceae bacterium]